MRREVLQGHAPTFVAYEQAEIRERSASNGPWTWVVREFFGRSDEALPGPQGFLVDPWPARSRVPAHFHSCDQFQVFFPAKDAWYQRYEVDSPLVHYTDAYTPYGPFGTAATPMCFATLRAAGSTLTGLMPDARNKLARRGRRHVVRSLGSLLGRRIELGASTIETLIEPQHDGLAAHLVIAGGQATFAPPTLSRYGSGQYLCIVGGYLWYQGMRFGERSLGWSGAGTSSAEFQADSDTGVELLVLQLPRDTQTHLPS